ncbi:MAG TPA: hypothetical protein VGK48_08900, partial [Terriglobia bacterium]
AREKARCADIPAGQSMTIVLVQREDEPEISPKRRDSALAGGDFEGMRIYRSDGWILGRPKLHTARPMIIVPMSPPGYPSAWLRPRSAASVLPDKHLIG